MLEKGEKGSRRCLGGQAGCRGPGALGPWGTGPGEHDGRGVLVRMAQALGSMTAGDSTCLIEQCKFLLLALLIEQCKFLMLALKLAMAKKKKKKEKGDARCASALCIA